MRLFCQFLAFGLNLIWLTLGDRLSLNQQLTIPVCTAGLLGLSLLFVPKTRRKGAAKGVLWMLLAYYLAILSVLLFFGGLFHLDRAWGGAVNLEPFRTIGNFWIHYKRTGSLFSLSNLLGNIVILVPLGVFLPVLFPLFRRFWVFLPFAAAVALGVEYLQWRTATGIADIDDSILNFFGAACGYFVTRSAQIVYDFLKKRRSKPL